MGWVISFIISHVSFVNTLRSSIPGKNIWLAFLGSSISFLEEFDWELVQDSAQKMEEELENKIGVWLLEEGNMDVDPKKW